MSRHEIPIGRAIAELKGLGEAVNFDELSRVAQVALLCETIVCVSRKADSNTRWLAVKELRSAARRLDLDLSDEFFD
jgi:hypothetical protein